MLVTINSCAWHSRNFEREPKSLTKALLRHLSKLTWEFTIYAGRVMWGSYKPNTYQLWVKTKAKSYRIIDCSTIKINPFNLNEHFILELVFCIMVNRLWEFRQRVRKWELQRVGMCIRKKQGQECINKKVNITLLLSEKQTLEFKLKSD